MTAPRVNLAIRVTLDFVYDVNPDAYGTNDPMEMARIDCAQAIDDLAAFQRSVEATYVTAAPIDLESQ
jgi:hypothetical protein